MNHILIIAYQFPPLNVGGSYRPYYFTKFLPEFNIQPVVITLNPEDFPNVYDSYKSDTEHLINKLPTSTPIEYIPGKNIIKYYNNKISLFFHTYFTMYCLLGKSWKPNFYEKIDAVIRKYNPSTILVTAPPFSIIPLAIKASKKYKIPLITDMRDAWTMWNPGPYLTCFHYFFTKKLENNFFKQSNAIIATSEQTLNDFKEIHKNVPHSKFYYIPNGYQKEIETWNLELNFSQKEEINIVYVGGFYYTPKLRNLIFTPWYKKKLKFIFQYTPRKEDWLYRSPYFFFKALHTFSKTYPEIAKKIKVTFAGGKPDWFDNMCNETGIKKYIRHIGVISHSDSIELQKKADVLLLTSAKVTAGRDYSIAGKTFEYIELQKPILSFVAEGAQKDMVEKTGLSLICDPDKPQESSNKMFDFFIDKIKLNPNEKFLRTLHRKHLTQNLVEVINKVSRA